MPLLNKTEPFKPNPIPQNVGPDDDVFYLELTNEIFTSHDEFFERYLFCNSLIWTCSRTGKSGLTYEEALKSEQFEPRVKQKKVKRDRESQEPAKASEQIESNPNGEPVKKKKKKYPYDPKKYAMPVPEGFDPSLLTPTGKIDGRKLKSKKNQMLAQELLSTTAAQQPPQTSSTDQSSPGKKGKQKKKEEEAKRKEEEAKKKAELQAQQAKERELEAKRKKEAAAAARQLERQKREEERKKATSFLANWEKKCEDLERDDLKRLPQPTALCCEIPDKLFGDALFIMESLYNLHEVYNFPTIYPDGMSFDTLEEILFEKQEEGPIGTLVQFLLKTIIHTQPTADGYGLDDDSTKQADPANKTDHNNSKSDSKDESTDIEDEHANGAESNGLERHGEQGEEDDDDEEGHDKDVRMNDLIGSAIKAAQEVKLSLSKPLAEMELDATTVTEILRLHLLQSGSFPKGRTIYNGWYSSREDPGLWLCMQEPDLIKKLGETSIYELDIEERIKILHTLIYQLFTFIKSRRYIESASEQLTEIRKQYRSDAAEFARWDRENCVKRMQPPKRKGEHQHQTSTDVSDKANGNPDSNHIKQESQPSGSHPSSINGDHDDERASVKLEANGQHLKSCLKSNGTEDMDTDIKNEADHLPGAKKKISFKTQSSNGAIGEAQEDGGEHKMETENGDGDNEEQSFEELERAYQQNLVDYEDYQRERAIRYEQLNQTLVELRSNLRQNQSVYGIHPIGRDRAYRRYWLFQSLAGLFVEQDDEYVGKCLQEPTPLESRYKKLFNKDNPLMQENEADLIRNKTCDATNQSNTTGPKGEHQQQQQTTDDQKQQQSSSTPSSKASGDAEHPAEQHKATIDDKGDHHQNGGETSNDTNNNNNHDTNNPDRQNGEQHGDDMMDDQGEVEPGLITDEMNICTGNETTCAVHGQKRPQQTRWWFYHSPESIDQLIERLNKRGYRESELLEVLTLESSIIKPKVSECPAFKLNKFILEQSGIRRSRRLKTKGSKRRGRNYDRD